MTPHEALAEGRLADAVATQRAAVEAVPGDHAARRLLVDLLAFAGEFEEAVQQLGTIDSAETDWAEVERTFHRLFRSEHLRSVQHRVPRIIPDPPPRHATRRWRAIKALLQADPEEAIRCADAADAITPEVWGFLDGQEFTALRDADDRFASVLEAFQGGEYLWFAWESLRKVQFSPATVLLDQLYRPAEITLKDGTSYPVHLPLVYPGSYHVDDSFALGIDTDHVCPDGGPTRCVGAKLLLVGETDEVPLSECRMIEIRG
jgi:type VI secretion system protein ImpE